MLAKVPTAPEMAQVEQAISNALKHAGARKLRIAAHAVEPDQIEIRIEDRFTLSTQIVRLCLEPLTHFLLLGICEQAALQIAHNIRILRREVVLLARIVC